jgi:glucose/arabinose dehydrogenase
MTTRNPERPRAADGPTAMTTDRIQAFSDGVLARGRQPTPASCIARGAQAHYCRDMDRRSRPGWTTSLLRLVGVIASAGALGAALTGCSSDADPASPTTSTATSVIPSATSSSTASADQLSPVPLTAASGVDVGAASGHSLNLPKGWSAQVWADVPGARLAVWAPDGRLIVSTGGNGKLALVTPGSGQRGPTVTTLLSGLDGPQGVAMTEQGGRAILVVGEQTRIVSWDYAKGVVSNRRVILDGLPSGGHGSKMVAVRDGQVVYNVGSSTNRDAVDRTSTPERATIAQVGLNGSGNRTLAVGVRNGEGLSFAPDGTLFAAINQADNQPYPFRDSNGQYGQTVRSYVNEHPNDQVSRITAGTDMGWPYCVPDSRGHEDLLNLGYVNDPTSNAGDAALNCTSIGRTQLGLPAHSAPVGFVFTHGSALPDSLANGALITAHGSWNRQPPRQPYVAYSAWDDTNQTLAPIRLLVTGFQKTDGSRWGRSVDAVPGPDGSVYVTDDVAGLVYRLTPRS